MTIPESDFSQLQEEMDELQGKLDNVEAEEIKMKASRFTFSKTATWMSVAIDGSSLGLAAAIALGSGAVLCSVM
ncbi:hypothetical protein BGZ57DRAFT_934957 [Hyaloscypha finlandica]|nr:hypothetical protein BGZ57DRAFT_934957 [Hyaloscypha finlandica]